MSGLVYQINAKPQTPNARGIPKIPVESVNVRFGGLEGDYNLYRMSQQLLNRGDLDKAVMFLPLETIRQLNQEGWPIKPGDLGENMTVEGIPYEAFAVGQRYSVGNAEIEISKPCKVLSVLPYVGQEKLKEFVQTLVNRRGWYARVLKEGSINVQSRFVLVD